MKLNWILWARVIRPLDPNLIQFLGDDQTLWVGIYDIEFQRKITKTPFFGWFLQKVVVKILYLTRTNWKWIAEHGRTDWNFHPSHGLRPTYLYLPYILSYSNVSWMFQIYQLIQMIYIFHCWLFKMFRRKHLNNLNCFK